MVLLLTAPTAIYYRYVVVCAFLRLFLYFDIEVGMKRILLLIWRGWKAFAHGLGVVNTHILLTVTYFVILAIVSLIARLFGADLLGKRLKSKASYWHRREPVDISLDACKHQF